MPSPATAQPTMDHPERHDVGHRRHGDDRRCRGEHEVAGANEERLTGSDDPAFLHPGARRPGQRRHRHGDAAGERRTVPRPSVRAWGTNVSAPKKANVSIPRDRTTAGSPAAPRSVPGGVSRRSGPRPTRTPPTIAGTSNQREAVKPATTSAAPPATPHASTSRRRRKRSAGGCPEPSGGQAHHRRHDQRSGDGDERQQPEEYPPPADP